MPELTQFSHYEVLNCIVLLRLAVLLNIKRQQDFLPDYQFQVDKNRICIHFPPGWLEEHPVISADLEKEKDQIEKANVRLEFH